MRMRITLSPVRHARVRLRAAEPGTSVAGYIRRLVNRDLEAPCAEADPRAIIGLFDSGGSDTDGQRVDVVGATAAEWAAGEQI